MDMIYGTTVEGLRHRTRANVLVIPSGSAQRQAPGAKGGD